MSNRWADIDPIDRYWAKVDQSDPSGCWLWTGSTTRGYGKIWMQGKNRYAHQLACEFAGVDIPEGFEPDHECGVPLCVRVAPGHIVVKPRKANRRAHPRLSANNTSGIRGVHWSSDCQKWTARVGVNGRNLYLGIFADIRDAERAAVAARLEHHGIDSLSIADRTRADELGLIEKEAL